MEYSDKLYSQLFVGIIFITIVIVFIYNIYKVNKKYKQNRLNQIKNSKKIENSKNIKIGKNIENSSSTTQNNINYNVEFNNIFKIIPDNILNLLWFLNGPLKNYDEKKVNSFVINNNIYNYLTIQDPSVIDINLSIKFSEPQIDIGYYPSYRKLNSEQRGKYIQWLYDVEKPIDTGYLFIYYYGLERHLFLGDFENAFKMILHLRKHHKNKSFLSYSANALLVAIIFYKKYDYINNIDWTEADLTVRLYIKSLVTKKLYAEDLIKSYKLVGFNNNRYINSYYEAFILNLTEQIKQKYGTEYYPVNQEILKSSPCDVSLALANYSFELKSRMILVPDITKNKDYIHDVYYLLFNTHETVKIILRNQRSKANKNKEVAEKEKKEPKFISVSINKNNLEKIREDSLKIQEKLIVEEAIDQLIIKPVEIINIDNQGETELIGWDEFKQSLTNVELKALKIMFNNEDIKQYCITNNIMLEVLIDEINQKAFDIVNDNIIGMDDEVVIYDEYRDIINKFVTI